MSKKTQDENNHRKSLETTEKEGKKIEWTMAPQAEAEGAIEEQRAEYLRAKEALEDDEETENNDYGSDCPKIHGSVAGAQPPSQNVPDIVQLLLTSLANQQQQQHQQNSNFQQPQNQTVNAQQLLLASLAQQQHQQNSNSQQQPQTNDQAAALIAVAQHLLVQQQAQAATQLLASAVGQPTVHNLIPSHLQSSTLAPSVNGTPGNPSTLIPSSMFVNASGASANLFQQQQQQLPALQFNSVPQPPPPPAMTVQDRPGVTPVYNGVNPQYPGLRVVNADPPIFCVDNFLTPAECQFLITVASDSFGPAPVVGKGAGEVSPSRTSSTCYLAREDLPDYLRKVSLLTGKPIEHCELPQVGRYLPSQQYLQHFDAFDTSNEDGRRFAANGGQRTITVLVYLNDVQHGGATRFPALNLEVQPRQGMALVFFPATVDGCLDKMALHAAMPAIDTKFVSQVWIRQSNYNGQPSKRLTQTMGPPFTTPLGSALTPQPLGQAQPVTSNSHTVFSNHLQQQVAQYQQQQNQAQQQLQQQYQQGLHQQGGQQQSQHHHQSMNF